jgi:multidrug efflux pump
MRSVMGIAVFSGMLGVTFFGLFFTPMFYVLLRKLEGKRSYKVESKAGVEMEGDTHHENLMSSKELKEMHT